MTSLVNPTIEVFFDLSASGVDDFLTLDDAVKGQLDDVLYPLAGDLATDVSDACYSLSIGRGRNRETDEIDAGTCTVGLRNYDARWLASTFHSDGPYLDQVDIGKRVRISTAGAVVFDGTIDEWNYQYNVDGSVDAQFTAVDALGSLARQSFTEWTTSGSQTAGPRLEAALSRGEVNFPANRDIDTGSSTLQSDLVTWGSNVLNYLQLVARSEIGRLFASRTGVLTFRDRLSLVNPTIAAEFSDAGDGIPFSAIAPATTSEVLFNRVGVDREGGVLQTANNLASQRKYKIRTLDLPGLLLSSDEQSADMAEFLSGIYSTPQRRIASITILLNALTQVQRAQVARLDLADVVSVRWEPVGADPITQVSVVEGVSHDTSVGDVYAVTLNLSPVAQTEIFTLDDAVLGVLDSGVLAF